MSAAKLEVGNQPVAICGIFEPGYQTSSTLEELGINFSHIKGKTLTVLNPFNKNISPDRSYEKDSDLAGPILFRLLLWNILLLAERSTWVLDSLHYQFAPYLGSKLITMCRSQISSDLHQQTGYCYFLRTC